MSLRGKGPRCKPHGEKRWEKTRSNYNQQRGTVIPVIKSVESQNLFHLLVPLFHLDALPVQVRRAGVGQTRGLKRGHRLQLQLSYGQSLTFSQRLHIFTLERGRTARGINRDRSGAKESAASHPAPSKHYALAQKECPLVSLLIELLLRPNCVERKERFHFFFSSCKLLISTHSVSCSVMLDAWYQIS